MSSQELDVVRREHADLQALFERVSRPEEDRGAVLQVIVQTLSAHIGLEKQVLAPALRDGVADSDALVERLHDDHVRAKHLLTLIGRRKVNSPDVPSMVTELMDLTDAHVAEADAHLIPALEAALDGEALRELAETWSSDEEALLTHPHPLLPDRGPVAAVTRRVAGVVDRVRDRSTDIGRGDS
jgi:hypothetical protein